jgi:hypothetical protein
MSMAVDVPSSTTSSRTRRIVGVVLFLVVTACWVFVFAGLDLGWLDPGAATFAIAAGLSAVSVVLTGYLGRTKDALWLGWIPGTAMVAAGIAMTPTPGDDEAGWSLIFFGGLTLIPGWPLYFFPLIATGAYIRSRRVKMLTPESSVLPL